jgi:heptosyltransferase-2
MDEIAASTATRAAPPPRPKLSFVTARVLVKEVNWLGDLVISLPALRAVRAAFESAKLAVLVKRELAGFFDGIGWIDEVIPYARPAGIGGIAEQWRIAREIRRRRFDLAILFPNSFQSALWATLGAARSRAGYATDGRAFMLTHQAAPARDSLERHQAYYWLGMLRDTLGIASVPGAEHHRLEIAERHLRTMGSWLAEHRVRPQAPLIAMAPAAAYGPAKEWPLVRYAALIDLLHDRFGAECVLVGAPDERARCAQVATTARCGALLAAGATGIGELIALLSLCGGFAGNDSGAMHLAAAVGIPAVGIFGSTNPARTGPTGARAGFIYHRVQCSPCLERTCRFGHYECLRSVIPEEVASSLARLGAFEKLK